MSPEILIYLQQIRHFIENNDEARRYFLANADEEFFYNQIEKISMKNFTKTGDPKLSVDQMELVRRMSFIAVNEKTVEEPKTFLDLKEYGKIFYN